VPFSRRHHLMFGMLWIDVYNSMFQLLQISRNFA
jgi:hypothetical protein